MIRQEILEVAKPILFNTDMTCAVLDDRKTATRRVAQPQPNPNHRFPLGFVMSSTDRKHIGCFGWGLDEYGGVIDYAKPNFKVSDILYVRETAMIQSMKNYEKAVKLYFRADHKLEQFLVSNEFYEKLLLYPQNKWLSPYYLTKEVARTFLRVTEVRVERLQDITEAGVVAEGTKDGDNYIEPKGKEIAPWHIACFEQLWNSTLKEKQTGALSPYRFCFNPWVWVYEFERLTLEVQNG